MLESKSRIRTDIDCHSVLTNGGIYDGIASIPHANNYDYQYFTKSIRYLVGAPTNMFLVNFKTP